LGIDLNGFSPAVLRLIVFVGGKESFAEGSRTLEELTGLAISCKQVQRVTEKIGAERVEERQQGVETYEGLPLPQRRLSPRQPVPRVVAVSMDGGRYQQTSAENKAAQAPAQKCPSEAGSAAETVLDDCTAESSSEGSHWREFKAGCLITLASEEAARDPCQNIPSSFLDHDHVARLSREIHGAKVPEKPGVFRSAQDRQADAPFDVGAAEGSASNRKAEAEAQQASQRQKRPGAPLVLVRTVLASLASNVTFGAMLAAAAWERGFAAATRKAYLSDGASGNWTVWKKFFSSYVPILDFIHLLSYIYAAAMAGQKYATGWAVYGEWIQHLWQGQVEVVLQALRQRSLELGAPPKDVSSSDPRKIVHDTLAYVEHNQSRMRYDEYRRLGLPITTCHMESTVKQINQRIKGTEKFWSSPGAEALLQLRGDHLSDTRPLDSFWNRREARATGQRGYCRAN
jgi:hypothetical protein